MKIFLLLSVSFFVFLMNVRAQIATGDAKGNNSVVLANSNIGIDIAESAIEFKWTNYNNETYRKKNTKFWGFSASGKSEEGIAPIFGEGTLTPGAKIQGFYALKVMSDGKLYNLIEKKKEIRQKDSAISADYKKYTNYRKVIVDVIADFANEYQGESLFALYSNKKSFQDTILKIQNDCICKADELNRELVKQRDLYSGQNKKLEADIYGDIISKITIYDSIARSYENSIDSIEKKINSVNQTMAKFTIAGKNGQRYKGGHTIFYLSGGMNATTFEQYDGSIASTNLNDRFLETKFRGAFLDIGINREFSPSSVGGLSFGYEKANTFDSLSKKDYSVRTSETQGGQTITAEKKHAGYSGFYTTYNRINIKSDFIKYYNLSEEFDIAWNMLYTRIYLPITDKEIKSVVNIGSGINFFKKGGQFAGGIYLESNDLFNTVSDAVFYKRLQISLVATFTFKSIVNRFANPE